MTKIAIPTRDERVDDDKQVTASERLDSPQGCGCKSNIASVMQDMGITIMFAVLSVGMCTSCDGSIDDLINDHMRYEYHDYLHNQTDEEVTVIFSSQGDAPAQHSYVVPRGGSVEIPDAERLGVSLRYLERDSVVFVFGDGTRVVHSYTNAAFGQDAYRFIYEPADNNIFYTGYDIPSERDSWVMTTLGTLKVRFDYTIKE